MTELMRRINAAVAIGSGRSPFSCEHCDAEIPVHKASDCITEVGPAYYVCEACREREHDRRMERLAEDAP